MRLEDLGSLSLMVNDVSVNLSLTLTLSLMINDVSVNLSLTLTLPNTN